MPRASLLEEISSASVTQPGAPSPLPTTASGSLDCARLIRAGTCDSEQVHSTGPMPDERAEPVLPRPTRPRAPSPDPEEPERARAHPHTPSSESTGYGMAPLSPPVTAQPSWLDTAITLRPSGGWPTVHLRDPDDVFFLERTDQADMWKALEAPKVRVIVYDLPIGTSGETVGIIRRVLAAAGYATAQISPPIASAQRRNGPNTALIYDISPEVAEALYLRHCISTILGTLIMVPINPLLPTFLATIQGLVTPDPERILVVIHVHLEGGRLGRLLLHLVSGHPSFQDYTPAQARTLILKTLRVEVWHKKFPGGIDVPVANVFMQPPTLDLAQWRVLRDEINTHLFTDNMYGTDVCQMPHRCSRCRGVGHPRGLCPYPLLPDWNGPGVTTLHPDNDHAGIPNHLLNLPAATAGSSRNHDNGGHGRGPTRGKGRM